MTDNNKLESFLHKQIEYWNSSDKKGFMDCYKAIATMGLSIEYIGLPKPDDSWQALEHMWNTTQDSIRIELVDCIATNNEASCYHINRKLDGTISTRTIETYRLDSGVLTARYYIGAGATDT